MIVLTVRFKRHEGDPYSSLFSILYERYGEIFNLNNLNIYISDPI